MSGWAAAAQVGGQLLDSWLGYKGQKETNELNSAEAAKNRDFQKEMSSTSYQRAVKDLQAAGLNPMLAYSQGGSSSPGGATAAPMGNALGNFRGTARGTAETMLAYQNLERNKAEVDQLNAMTAKTRSETMEQSLNTARLIEETERTAADAANRRADWRGRVADSSTKIEHLDQMLRQGGFEADVAKRKAEARTAAEKVGLTKAQRQVTELEIPKSQADAKFWESFEHSPQVIKLFMSVLRAVSSARSVGAGFR